MLSCRLALAVLVLTAAAAHADPSCPAVAAETARARFEEGDIAGALKATQSVERCNGGTPHELADALRWRAQALSTKGNTAATLSAFAWVSTVDPSYVPDPPLPPELQEVFTQGRAQAESDHLMLLRLLRPATDDSGTWVRVEIFGFGQPTRVDAIFRESVTVSATLESPGVYRAKVPPGRPAPYRFRAILTGFEFTSFSGESPRVVAPVPVPGVDAPRASTRLNRAPWIPMGIGALLGVAGVIGLLVGNGMLLPIAQGDLTINTAAELDARITQATTLQYGGVVALCIAGAAVLASSIWVGIENKRVVTLTLLPGGGAAFAFGESF